MPNKIAGFITIVLSLALFGALLSCATDKTPMQIDNSLPQNELAYYNDTFDKMREDLWNKAGYINLKEQIQNFRLADMRIENGKLIIRTKAGSFSKGGLGSKYALRGDFDIQLDCRIDFLEGASGMDQLLSILVLDKTGKIGKVNAVYISLAMEGGLYQGWLSCGYFINGKKNRGGSRKIGNFNGTLRILRTGKTISTIYKKEGAPDWNKMNTFRVTDKDMIINFQLRNYVPERTTIGANNSISAEFDNFRINAVHEIIEEEI